MHTSVFRILPLLPALALVAGVPAARAQLMLSGDAHGSFIDPGLPHTTVINGPVTSVFSSGVPYRPKKPYYDTPTSITFNGDSFADVGNGDALDLGFATIKNGITLLGTTAASATMDVFLDFTSAGITNFKLTTLTFSIDNTANNGTADVPDLFQISYSPLNSLSIDGHLITFSLFFSDSAFVTDGGKSIPENSSATTGDIFVNTTITAVPEPSTYAIAGAALLCGLVLLRRLRRPDFALGTTA